MSGSYVHGTVLVVLRLFIDLLSLSYEYSHQIQVSIPARSPYV